MKEIELKLVITGYNRPCDGYFFRLDEARRNLTHKIGRRHATLKTIIIIQKSLNVAS